MYNIIPDIHCKGIVFAANDILNSAIRNSDEKKVVRSVFVIPGDVRPYEVMVTGIETPYVIPHTIV